MEGRNCDGRYIPETPQKSVDGKAVKRTLLDSMSRSIDTEINLQLGDFTLKTSTLDTLEPHITTQSDFLSIFDPPHRKDARPKELKEDGSGELVARKQLGPIPCANIKMTTHREHYRLVGRRFDVLFWKSDDRSPPRTIYTRPYAPQQLDETERSVQSTLALLCLSALHCTSTYIYPYVISLDMICGS